MQCHDNSTVKVVVAITIAVITLCCMCGVVETLCWVAPWMTCRSAVCGRETISSLSLCPASSTTWTNPVVTCLVLSRFDAFINSVEILFIVSVDFLST